MSSSLELELLTGGCCELWVLEMELRSSPDPDFYFLDKYFEITMYRHNLD